MREVLKRPSAAFYAEVSGNCLNYDLVRLTLPAYVWPLVNLTSFPLFPWFSLPSLFSLISSVLFSFPPLFSLFFP